jgi:hypothetical protein
MSQTAYSQRLTEALAGMLATPIEDCLIDSKINAADLPAGVFVTRDASDEACKVPTTSGEVTASGIGFTVLNLAHEPPSDGSTVDIPATKGCGVIRRGRIWVLTETAMTYGQAVFVRFTANGGNTQLGKVRNDADTANAVAAPGWQCLTTLAAGGLAIIER